MKKRVKKEESMDKFVERQEVLKLLNAPSPEERLANLAIIIGGERSIRR